MSEEILFITHKKNDGIEKAARKLRREMGNRKLSILSHSVEFNLPGVPVHHFDRSVLHKTGFPVIGDGIIPGHAHFPIFSHIEKTGFQHEFYWVIEYDVRFTGKWQLLWKYYNSNSADLITTHINGYPETPDWPWWELSHPANEIPLPERIRSFNPIYRISAKAVLFLSDAFRSGWKGHNEVIIPTLLHHYGYKILDMGGNGMFTENGKRFYTGMSDRNGKLLTGTFRHKPPMKRPGILRNRLYHPVKKNGVGLLRNSVGSLYRTMKLNWKQWNEKTVF